VKQLTRSTLALGARALSATDPDLAAIVRRHGVPPFWGRRPGFQTLIRIILEQQVSLAAARTMYRRLAHHAGEVSPEALIALGITGLRALGFTRQKAAYCVHLAEAIHSGRLDLTAVAGAEVEAGRRMLLQMRGLGPWSVDIYFLMALRRPDVWPHGDLALADAVHRIKRLRRRPDHDALTLLARQWAPWRSVAARILWQDYLSRKAR